MRSSRSFFSSSIGSTRGYYASGLAFDVFLILETESRGGVCVESLGEDRTAARLADPVRSPVEHPDRAIDVLELGAEGTAIGRASRA